MKVKYLFPLIFLLSCTMQTRLNRISPAAKVNQLVKTHAEKQENAPKPLRIEQRGDSVYLVETEKIGDETVPTLKAATVNVVSRVRNVSERYGILRLGFEVTIPRIMLGTSREILLYPTLLFNGDSLVFQPICLRGKTMDILQSRENWQLIRHIKFYPKDTNAVERFLIFPYIQDARLDSVIQKKDETTIVYTESISSVNMPRRLNLAVPGKVLSIDGTKYIIPPRDTIGYLISSMTEFIDTTTKHRIRIVDRNISVEQRSHIVFQSGKHILVDSLGNNRKEISKILETQQKVRELPDLELDSIVITSTASPEGSYRNNARLSQLRGKSVADSLFGEFHPIIHSNPENWEDLLDSIKSMRLTRGFDIENIIHTIEDPDLREEAIRNRYPREYAHIRKTVYPTIRIVSVRYFMHRIGMTKDTLHLNEIDTTYMEAVQRLSQRQYAKALETLSSYQDRNTAIAYMSLGYDRQALEIISKEPESDIKEYLLAILSSRLGMKEEARKHYLNACRLNSSMEFRGNLDPEINNILIQ